MESSLSSATEDEMKKCLRDAGISEEHMNEEELRECYIALKSSESTAKEETLNRALQEKAQEQALKLLQSDYTTKKSQTRRTSDSSSQNIAESNSNVHRPCIPQVRRASVGKSPLLSVKQSTLESKSQLLEHKSHSSTLVDPTPFLPSSPDSKSPHQRFSETKPEKPDPFDCPKETNPDLPLIKKDPKYNQPFYLQHTELDAAARCKMIMQQHTKILEMFQKYQRQSTHRAPWGKAISTNSRFNGTLCKEKIIWAEDDENQVSSANLDAVNIPEVEPEEQIYVLRTGRVSRRIRQYAEEIDDSEEKVKKPRFTSKKQSTPKININEEEVNLNASGASTSNAIEKSSNETNTPKASEKTLGKRPRNFKQSNDEIIKRSKLFNDTIKKTRSEKLFDKFLENEHDRKITEKKMEKFHDSLMNVSDDDDFESNNADGQKEIEEEIEVVAEKEKFVKKRVMPPNPGRGQYRRKQTIVEVKDDVENARATENNERISQFEEEIEVDEPKMYPQTQSWVQRRRGIKHVEMSECPICKNSYPQSEIMFHASSCSYCEPPTKENKYIVCFKCNNKFLLSTDYELHVLQCKRNH